MKIAFALYVALTWAVGDAGRQILDLHKTYETKEACENASKVLDNKGVIPIGFSSGGNPVMDYFCIQVPGQ